MSSLRFPTDHTGFGAESNAEREEREATMLGAWTVEVLPHWTEVVAEDDEIRRESALVDHDRRVQRHLYAM